MVSKYFYGLKKSFRRMPRMTILSVLSDIGLVASLGHITWTFNFDVQDFITISASTLGVVATRSYLFELNRFDDHMRKFVREREINDNFLDNQKFMDEACDYASRYKIHDFKLYLKRNFSIEDSLVH